MIWNCEWWCAVRLGSHPADAAMAKFVQGTKVLTYGGYERVFENTFGILQGEKLLKQYACYISTSNGPIIGTLYISTARLAFCSDYPFYYYPVSPHNNQSIYYKVLVTFLLFSPPKVDVSYCHMCCDFDTRIIQIN